MTINEFIQFIEPYQYHVAAYFLVLPFITWFFTKLYDKSDEIYFMDYIFTFLIYIVTIPGMFSVTLVFYTMFLLHLDMTKVNVVLYFIPIVSMISIYIILARKTDLRRLPGFDRLSGLLVMIGLIFIAIFFLYRLRFHIAFFSSLTNLLFIGVILFGVFKIASNKVFKKE